jgi:predicted aspartyl protease
MTLDRARFPLSFLCVLLAVAAAGCSGDDEEAKRAPTVSATTSESAPTTTGERSATTPVVEDRQTIPIRVVSGPGGVFAFAKVYIGGKGPFAFTVDTGASHSVVDFDVVRKLGLETIGDPVIVTGITCRGEAGRLQMGKWRAHRVALPAREIQTIDMPEPGGGIEIDGLLGSDVLSAFGAITVDYESERLLLGVTA